MVSEAEEEDSTVHNVVAVEDSTAVRNPVLVRARDVLLFFELSLWDERWQECCYTSLNSSVVTLSYASQQLFSFLSHFPFLSRLMIRPSERRVDVFVFSSFFYVGITGLQFPDT